MLNLKDQANVQTTQKVQLVEGGFSASEAMDVICALIEQKINFHKLQRLSICEGHCDADTEFENRRIDELLNEMKIAKEYLAEARRNGQMVTINGVLDISILK